MYKIIYKLNQQTILVNEKDISKMFRPQTLKQIYDKLDKNQPYENEKLIIKNNC